MNQFMEKQSQQILLSNLLASLAPPLTFSMASTLDLNALHVSLIDLRISKTPHAPRSVGTRSWSICQLAKKSLLTPRCFVCSSHPIRPRD